MADIELIKKLWESDQAFGLTNQAAREIEKLEAELQAAVNERNDAWFQLEENNIKIVDVPQTEIINTRDQK